MSIFSQGKAPAAEPPGSELARTGRAPLESEWSIASRASTEPSGSAAGVSTGDQRNMSNIQIRLASEADCTAINDIYNYYVIHSTCTYQTEPETLEGRRAWFHNHGPQHPVIVAELNGIVVGWGSLSRFHARAAYARSIENAVYVHHDHHGHGIGKKIMLDLLARAAQLGHHTMIALVSAEQTASIGLHEKLGFSRVGQLTEAGFKSNQWLDVVYLQKML